MKNLLWLILLLRMALVCPAAEIVAWKVPLDYYAGNGLETKGVVRRGAPPESSPFFKPGDELWDLKGVVPYQLPDPKLSLDWLVWNATSGQLVAKGDWADLSAIQGLLRLDQRAAQCRVTLNVFQVPADKAPPKADSKPLQSVSLAVRSGQRAKADWKQEKSGMKLEAEAAVAGSEGSTDLRVTCSAQVPDQLRMEVNTDVTVKSGEPKWIARDFDGLKGLDFQLTASNETMDGVLLEDQVMIQRGNLPQRLVAELKAPGRQRVGNGWLLIYPVAPGVWAQITNPAGQEGADPFANTGSNEPAGSLHLPSVKPPEFLNGWLKNEVLDVGELLEKLAPEVKGSGNFAGYDPIRKCLYFYSGDEASLDPIEQLFMSGCYCPPATIIVNLDGIGETRLVAKTGRRTSLSRLIGKKAVKRLLEIEPTISEREDVEMRLHFEDETNPDQETHLDTSTVFPAGKAKELYSSSEGDPKTRLNLKADIERMSWD